MAEPDDGSLDLAATLASMPPEWPDPTTASISALVRSGDETVVVLDDDPTGTQTVYDVPVLTDWSTDLIEREFEAGTPAFYVLTNTRSNTPREAEDINREIASRLVIAADKYGRRLCVISRSDSCLRGHYPLEIDVLADSLGGGIDGQIIAPFFLEGGRLTVGDVHYVAEGDWLIPAAATPFALDAAFGFTESNLKDYVEEKTRGRIRREDVVSITIEDVRRGGPDAVRDKLRGLSNMRACVVNAVTLRDMEVFALGMLRSESEDGKRFLVRSAASFVQARIGLPKRPVLGASEICRGDSSRGGLVVVGSYVPKTTSQLTKLLELDGLESIELDVSHLIDPSRRKGALRYALDRAEGAISSGRHAVVYTSRSLVAGGTPEESLAIGNAVSSSLVRIVSDLTVAPRFIIAKGGITSSDVATRGLGIRRALVLGQAAPGVPVWEVGEGGKFPGSRYVVFPGNVGAEDELKTLVERLSE